MIRVIAVPGEVRGAAAHDFSMKSDCRTARAAATATASSGACEQVGVGVEQGRRAAPRLRRSSSRRAAPGDSAGRSGSPTASWPSTSPSRRCSRSTRLSSKPSVVAATASSRSRAGMRSRAVRDQQAQPGVAAPADPAAQLVELGDAEPVGVEQHHRGRVGDVDADLDHRRRDQHVDVAARRRRASCGPSRPAGIRPCSISTRRPASGPSASSLGDLLDGRQRRRGAGAVDHRCRPRRGRAGRSRPAPARRR